MFVVLLVYAKTRPRRSVRVVTDGDYVYKTLHTLEESAAVYRRWSLGLKTKADLEQLASDALDHARISLQGVSALLQNHPQLAPNLANPVIDEHCNYRQDKVRMMGTVLRQVPRARAHRYIDRFIDLLLFHAGYGLADPILQMCSNYGVNKDDQVVLTDLGELAFDKNTAITAARTAAWREAYTYKSRLTFLNKLTLPRSLRPYYNQQMQARFTPEAVEANWLI